MVVQFFSPEARALLRNMLSFSAPLELAMLEQTARLLGLADPARGERESLVELAVRDKLAALGLVGLAKAPQPRLEGRSRGRRGLRRRAAQRQRQESWPVLSLLARPPFTPPTHTHTHTTTTPLPHSLRAELLLYGLRMSVIVSPRVAARPARAKPTRC